MSHRQRGSLQKIHLRSALKYTIIWKQVTPKRENQVASRFMFSYLSYTAQACHLREEYCLFLLIIEMTDCELVVEELIDLISVK